MASLVSTYDSSEKIKLCNEFLNELPANRYILGRNDYSLSLADQIDFKGFVDDFCSETSYLGKPVLKCEDLPHNSFTAVTSIIARPLTASKRLEQLKLKHIDYFTLLKHSSLNLKKIVFWNDFEEDFFSNEEKYNEIYTLLSDGESKSTFKKIINFRITSDLFFMSGFTPRQKYQYFEDFLELAPDGEVFCDVGCFDGYTSLEFIKRCPNYRSINIFEPDMKNMQVVKKKLNDHKEVFFINKGLSNKHGIVKFSSDGSSSTICTEGNTEISIDTLDNIVNSQVSFIKMDIEGAEKLAIKGAKQTILKYHPKLAVCVYHGGKDMREIPELILDIRSDYTLYLRHYTEGFTETVMFFIPN